MSSSAELGQGRSNLTNFPSVLLSSSCSSFRVIKSYFYYSLWFSNFPENLQRCLFILQIFTHMNTSHTVCSWFISLSTHFFKIPQLCGFSICTTLEPKTKRLVKFLKTCYFRKTFWERIWPLQIPRTYTLFTGTHVCCWITRFSST